MSKKESNTITALSTQSTVSEGIKTINTEIAKLKHIQDSVYKTPGKITMGNGQSLDINTQTSVAELVKAFSGVQARIKAIETAYETLGYTTYPEVKIDGGTLREWKEDIVLRIQIIEQQGTLTELSAMKKEWEELMDKEDRKALLVEKLQKFSESRA